MFAVYYRPDLKGAAEELKRRLGAVDLSCDEEFSHVFILGGDGTLLYAIREFPCVLDAVVVHLGMGSVNFYRSASPGTPLDEIVSSIASGNYRVVELPTLACGECTALNEVLIHRAEPGRPLRFRLVTDEGELAGRADGVIVSTPQGALGYAVSALGPAVDYRADVIVVSFAAPFTLYLRPLVLASDSVVVETADSSVLVCDGRVAGSGTRFEVRRGSRRLRLAVVGRLRYLDRVLERLKSL